MNAYKLEIPESRLTRLGFVTLIVVSVLVAILLASALNSYTRVSDSALAQVSPPLLDGGGQGGGNAPRTSPGKNYLPIIFLNSATAGGAWLLAGNAGTNPANDFLGTTDNMTLTIRVSNTVAYRIVPAADQTNGFGPNLIGGPSVNSIAPGLYGATIAGGGTSLLPNVIAGTGDHAFIGGGWNNTASGNAATIGGGSSNTASGAGAIIGGGYHNLANNAYATIGGGEYNTASGITSTLTGGQDNIVRGTGATMGGGLSNTIGVTATYAFIGGGNKNVALGGDAIVGGGLLNTASGFAAVVGGGESNIANGDEATVPGGEGNTASGNYSFAAGLFAKANHQGTFVWGDSMGTPFASTATNQFLIRAGGGVGIGTNSPDTQLHVVKSANGSGNNPGDNVTLLENTNTGNSADVLALKIGSVITPARSNNFVTFLDGNNNSLGAIQGNDNNAVEYVSGSADYAEYLPRANANEALAPGDLVGVFNGRITKATGGAAQVMVVSTGAIVAGNDPGETKRAGSALIAFIGQARVRVRGIVRAGDFIIPSGDEDGTGIAVSPEVITSEQFAQVVGQAWESSDDTGLKSVNVAVGLIRNDPTVARLVAHNQTLDARVSALEQSQSPSPISVNTLVIGALVLGAFVVGRRIRF